MSELTFRFAAEQDTPLILHFIRELAEYELMADQVVTNEEQLRAEIFEKKGAEVIFEDVLSKQYKFRVAEIEYLHRTQGEALPSKYPLSVFTCTSGGLDRIILRCETAE
jgi:hypothetical protein